MDGMKHVADALDVAASPPLAAALMDVGAASEVEVDP